MKMKVESAARQSAGMGMVDPQPRHEIGEVGAFDGEKDGEFPR